MIPRGYANRPAEFYFQLLYNEYMDTEEPPQPQPQQDADVYQLPTLRERAMRRHPASGKETINETLGRIGVDPTLEHNDVPTGSIGEHMGVADDGEPDET